MIQVSQAKRQSEILNIPVNFVSMCADGEYIATASSIATVEIGEDPVVDILTAVPTVSRSIATQKVEGGTVGVIYKISVAGRSNLNNIYVIEMLLAIIADTDE